LMHNSVGGIVLFDPAGNLSKKWNAIKIPKILFGSGWANYEDFNGAIPIRSCNPTGSKPISIEEQHYFVNSFPQIETELLAFLSQFNKKKV
jgi:hypothetical protein